MLKRLKRLTRDKVEIVVLSGEKKVKLQMIVLHSSVQLAKLTIGTLLAFLQRLVVQDSFLTVIKLGYTMVLIEEFPLFL